MNNTPITESIVLGGGCFWCTEAVFKMLRGVKSVMPGYAGGTNTKSGQSPTYEEVSTGKTGHAEAVKIVYDPLLIKLEDLLTVFFATHDPTTPDRQGNDIGPQYRSIILYNTSEQRVAAEMFIKELNASSASGAPIVTELKPLKNFYEAEDYHQDYYAKNSRQMYCQVVINPKLEKVQQKFGALLDRPEEHVR